MKRNALLPLFLVFVALVAGPSLAADLPGRAGRGVDLPALVARADLNYDKAVERSEDGLPLGNGRMGSLLWTTPAALHLQINRVDLFPTNCATDSFPQRNTDYCCGCGFVDVDFGDGAEVFPNDATRQHLSCYDGLATIEGKAVKIRALAWMDQDVMALEIDDQREKPGPINIVLKTLRPRVVKTGNHTALSMLGSRHGGEICLTQEFTEGDYFCQSEVVFTVPGRKSTEWRFNEVQTRLVVEPGKGAFTVFIASDARFKREEHVVMSTSPQGATTIALRAAAANGFAGLLESNQKWWSDFWSKSFVQLHSEDGAADLVEQHYTFYLYLMACTSRGKLPTKFNGMLWNTGGDTRAWGSQYWGANQSCLYNNALLQANHIELTDPMYDMYTGMYDACAVAAQQQWGSRGVFIPETVAFDGLAPLPDDIAAEMRDLYLLKRPWDTISQTFLNYAGTKQPHSSRWNWIQGGGWEDGKWNYTQRGSGPYGPVTHIFSRGGKIAYQYWQRYEFTQDKTWLRDRAYPMLKGVAEFYRNYPNVKKDADGAYHIWNVNSNESLWGGRDTDEEIASMRGIFPVAIRAAEILNVDAEQRAVWQDFLDHLAPLARSDNPDANLATPLAGPPVWIRALKPVVGGRGGARPDGNTMPIWFFDLCTLESAPDVFAIGKATFDAYTNPTTQFRQRDLPGGGNVGGAPAARPAATPSDTPGGASPANAANPAGGPPRRRGVGVLSKVPLVAATMGQADAVRRLLPSQVQTQESPALANRMDLREGRQTTSAQRLGNAADALQAALCQSFPGGPGKQPVIRVFAAWPKDWDADFTLLCRGGFLTSSAMHKGQVEFVGIQSQLGGECRLRNPWDGGEVQLERKGKPAEMTRGPLIIFETKPGEEIVLKKTSS